jgi:hypothetical protein
MFDLFKRRKIAEAETLYKIVWRCDYCLFRYYPSTKSMSPFLEIVQNRSSEEVICTVGKGDEFADYDVNSPEAAIESALDVLHLFDVTVSYDGKTDEEMGMHYGEYGSGSEWLTKNR